MSKLKATLLTIYGKSKYDMGCPEKGKKFVAANEIEAKFMALKILMQMARRMRTSNRFMKIELEVDCDCGDPWYTHVFYVRGNLRLRRNILRLTLNNENVEKAWGSERRI